MVLQSQDLGSAALNILWLLVAPASDPSEEYIAIVEPGEDERHGQDFLHLTGLESGRIWMFLRRFGRKRFYTADFW